ncbi:hypothetical protein PR048_016837 [Dryococelus australis]|uniref:Reverse transcriptase domain-containing protein n=1 Tax=Dryococelus australis TaxID=614101 RepID=A0ABQ9H7T5_9NEOP|nr:hypothetical protein PR048_016837 [Dryococelus australis]
MSKSDDEAKKLSDMFDEGLGAFNSISNTEEATNSSDVQRMEEKVRNEMGKSRVEMRVDKLEEELEDVKGVLRKMKASPREEKLSREEELGRMQIGLQKELKQSGIEERETESREQAVEGRKQYAETCKCAISKDQQAGESGQFRARGERGGLAKGRETRVLQEAGDKGREPEVVFLGSSIVKGVELRYIRKEIAYKAAFREANTRDLEERVSGMKDSRLAKDFRIHVGGNDLAHEVGQEVERNLRGLLRKVREKFPGARTVVSGVLVRKGVSYRMVVAASEVYERVCRDLEATFIDRKCVGWESVGRDQVHLAEQGKRILGDMLGREVADCMERAAGVEIGGKQCRMVKQSTSIKIMVVNCRSVYNKLEGFWGKVEVYGADIVVAVETWLTEEVLAIECKQDKFTIFRRYRDGRGGGIMVCVRKGLKGAVEWVSEDVEVMEIKLSGSSNRSITLLAAYRSPGQGWQAIEMIKERVDRLKDRQWVVVAGDLNMPGRMAAQLVNRGLVQVVETPTRWNEEGVGSVLGVVLVRPRNAVVGVIVLDGISDHHIPVVEIGIGRMREVQMAEKLVWQYGRGNKKGAEIFLRDRFEKWSMEEGVEGLWREFRRLMEVMLEKFVPMKRLRTGGDPPYYGQEILKMMKCRKLHAKGGEEGIPLLTGRDGRHATNDQEKSEILQGQYLSVFEAKEGWNRVTNRVRGVFRRPDGIGNAALKFGGRELAKYLEVLFKKSLGESKLPQDWKDAMVVPIHKQGEDRGRPGSYRPVSLTSRTGKVMERLVVQYVHGFRRGYSCETQLAGLLEDLVQVVYEGKQVDACFIDFEKVFDKVPHGTLMRKVEVGIPDRTVVERIGDFLRGRRQRVKVGEAILEEEEVTSGVPQGSMLGPLLFTIMVNFMGLGIWGKIILFADDCVVYEVGERGGNLQADIDKIWLLTRKNKMKINIRKTKVVRFTRKKMISRDMYRWEGQEIEEAAEYKYLGIVLQGDLRVLNGVSCEVKEKAYGTMVRPMLEYAAAVWDPYVEVEVRELEKVQRKVARWVKGRWRRQGQDGEEEGLHCKLSKGMFRGRGNNSEKLQRVWRRTERGRQSMPVRSVREWNVLREEFVSVRGVGKFRKGVEKELVGASSNPSTQENFIPVCSDCNCVMWGCSILLEPIIVSDAKITTLCNKPPSKHVQVRIRKTMALLEDTTRLVSLVGMFSRNETVEDVATENIKLFLLPALLGTLSLKMCVEDRLEVVNTAEVYFRDFLQRCNDYGITNLRIPEKKGGPEDTPQPQPQSLLAMVDTRNTKIKRYTEKKQLEEQLKILKNSDSFATDDDIKRNYFLALVKSFAVDAIDELDSIEKEKPLVEYMSNLKKEGRSEHERPRKYPHKPLRPIIITRDEVQKKVFGSGYPSIPTMTLEEFYEKRVQEGELLLPPRRTGFVSLRGHSQIFAFGDHARRCCLSAGFLGALLLPMPLHSSAAPYLTSPSSAFKTWIAKKFGVRDSVLPRQLSSKHYPEAECCTDLPWLPTGFTQAEVLCMPRDVIISVVSGSRKKEGLKMDAAEVWERLFWKLPYSVYGIFPNPMTMKSRTLQDVASAEGSSELQSEQEAMEKEQRMERDDPEELRHAREFDEFKDEHRRGEGNRMNRS